MLGISVFKNLNISKNKKGKLCHWFYCWSSQSVLDTIHHSWTRISLSSITTTGLPRTEFKKGLWAEKKTKYGLSINKMINQSEDMVFLCRHFCLESSTTTLEMHSWLCKNVTPQKHPDKKIKSSVEYISCLIEDSLCW